MMKWNWDMFSSNHFLRNKMSFWTVIDIEVICL